MGGEGGCRHEEGTIKGNLAGRVHRPLGQWMVTLWNSWTLGLIEKALVLDWLFI